MYSKLNPEWYISWDIHDKKQGLDGKYHISTIGCGCCSGYEHLEPEEYIELLKNMIDELEKLLKDAIEHLPKEESSGVKLKPKGIKIAKAEAPIINKDDMIADKKNKTYILKEVFTDWLCGDCLDD